MDERLVGRTPPKEHQFKPGESGNPNEQPKHRTNLWTYFIKYMAMTADDRAKVDRTKLTAAQETALKMVEKAMELERALAQALGPPLPLLPHWLGHQPGGCCR